MTPIQKAKEIALSHMMFFMNADENRSYADSVDQWIETVEAQQILSGEDWISVKDRLPDIGDEYLVVYDLEDGDEPLTTAMQFDAIKNKWYDERAAGTECKTVLFWMPLPEPPKP